MKETIASGNLGRNAEVRNINGKDYLCFPLAIAGTRKDAPTEWVDICYPAPTEGVFNYLSANLVSGAKVLVIGRNTISVYESKDGSYHASETIWARTLEVLTYQPKDAADAPKAIARQPQDNRQVWQGAGNDNESEDLPFD